MVANLAPFASGENMFESAVNTVPNGRRKTRLDYLVWLEVNSGLMMEIRLTGQSGLSKLTRPGLVQPGPPGNRIFYFYHNILCSNKAFLN